MLPTALVSNTRKRRASDGMDEHRSQPAAKRMNAITISGELASRNPQVFPFLKLPAEVRNVVYDILAVDAKENPIGLHKAIQGDGDHHFKFSSWR